MSNLVIGTSEIWFIFFSNVGRYDSSLPNLVCSKSYWKVPGQAKIFWVCPKWTQRRVATLSLTAAVEVWHNVTLAPLVAPTGSTYKASPAVTKDETLSPYVILFIICVPSFKILFFEHPKSKLDLLFICSYFVIKPLLNYFGWTASWTPSPGHPEDAVTCLVACTIMLIYILLDTYNLIEMLLCVFLNQSCLINYVAIITWNYLLFFLIIYLFIIGVTYLKSTSLLFH